MENTYEIAIDMLERAEVRVCAAIGEVVAEDDMLAVEMIRHAFMKVQTAEWSRMQESRQ